MNNDDRNMDWNKTIWDVRRRERLRHWCKLTLGERLLAAGRMSELTERFHEIRKLRQRADIAFRVPDRGSVNPTPLGGG